MLYKDSDKFLSRFPVYFFVESDDHFEMLAERTSQLFWTHRGSYITEQSVRPDETRIKLC